MVGDKPRWYSHYLAPVYYQVHNPHSSLGHDLLDDSDDSGPLFDDEDDISDSDISLGDEEYMHLQKERTLSVDLDLTTKAREVKWAVMFDVLFLLLMQSFLRKTSMCKFKLVLTSVKLGHICVA